MNGPEHYREAERLEQLAIRQWERRDYALARDLTMPQAQLHATLALAAATARPAIKDYLGDEADARAWSEVAS